MPEASVIGPLCMVMLRSGVNGVMLVSRRKSPVPRHHAPIKMSQAERPFQHVAADILHLRATDMFSC